ncbi:MAG: hypothetical protein KGI28_08030 [Thaumarchaeota archaeon]|nr:hypothetical protein [Nitrososphaerota archaeon]
MADTEKKCNICGKAFENSNKLNQHKLESHKDKPKNVKTKSSNSRLKVTGIAAAIAVVIVLAVYFSDNSTTSVTSVDGVNCDPTEAFTFHIHAHLDMIVDNKFVTIPAGIGIKQNECLFWLHTHTDDGIIHIESPATRVFTLGQFIQVWDSTPGISSTFEKLTNGDANLKVFVNGNEVKNTFDKIALSAHDEIVIISGTVPPAFPSTYQFPEGD